MTASENERLARVETQVEDMKKKVDEMHAAFLAAKGAKWVVITLWISVGAALANLKWFLASIGVRFE